MKKTIPFISPLAFGAFGGLLIECILGALSIMVSPFSDLPNVSYIVFLCIISALAALVITTVFIANIVYFMDLTDRSKTRMLMLAEAFVTVLLLFAFWGLWEYIISAAFHLP